MKWGVACSAVADGGMEGAVEDSVAGIEGSGGPYAGGAVDVAEVFPGDEEESAECGGDEDGDDEHEPAELLVRGRGVSQFGVDGGFDTQGFSWRSVAEAVGGTIAAIGDGRTSF